MMQSEKRITRANAPEILKQFADEKQSSEGLDECRFYEDRFQKLCSLSTDELTALYQSQKDIESEIGNQVITYIHENTPINSKNIGEVTAKLRERLRGV